MRRILTILLIGILSLCNAQAQLYQYLSTADGLSDRRVLTIEKDKTGFLWFLTYTSIDRYDGKNIVHYNVDEEGEYTTFYTENNKLTTDSKGTLWYICENGQTFKYHPAKDKFLEINVPSSSEAENTQISLIELTTGDEIWYVGKNKARIYNIQSDSWSEIEMDSAHNHPTSIYQCADGTYYIGTEHGICHMKLEAGHLTHIKNLIPDSIIQNPEKIFFHTDTERVIAASKQNGLIIYDLTLDKTDHHFTHMKELMVTDIIPYGKDKTLIATQGAGVWVYKHQEEKMEMLFWEQTDIPNGMNGNYVRSMHVDDKKRIWMAVYPKGITIYNDRYPAYLWTKSYIGNQQTLKNDQVNYILEDSEGDIWYATNNGVSMQNPKNGTWRHFLYAKEAAPEMLNIPHDKEKSPQWGNTFLSLCETEPGKIAVGGYMTGIYTINKQNGETERTIGEKPKDTLNRATVKNSHIRAIYKENDTLLWSGGDNYLECKNTQTGETKTYDIETDITCIEEGDSATLYIGTGNGLFTLHRKTEEIKKIDIGIVTPHINCLYQHPNGRLYIGTNRTGLIVKQENGSFKTYNWRNSALLFDNIYAIIPDGEKHLIISTGPCISRMDLKKDKFINWTSNQGLIKTTFNPRAGIRTKDGAFILGTSDGAIRWDKSIHLPREIDGRIVFTGIDLQGEQIAEIKDLLGKEIWTLDSLKELRLSHHQNNLDLQLASINFDAPLYTYIRWTLEGRDTIWNRINQENWIHLYNLSPNVYKLKARLIAQEDRRVLDEREIRIHISPPIWLARQSKAAYLLIGLCLLGFILTELHDTRIKFRRQTEKEKLTHLWTGKIRKMSALNSTLVGEIAGNKHLTPQEQNYLKMAERNMTLLSHIGKQITELTSPPPEGNAVYATHHLLTDLTDEYHAWLEPIATPRNIHVTCRHEGEKDDEVLTNKRQTDLIVYLLASCLIDNFGEEGGELHLTTKKSAQAWFIRLKGVPEKRNWHENGETTRMQIKTIRNLTKEQGATLETPEIGDYILTFPQAGIHFWETKKHEKMCDLPGLPFPELVEPKRNGKPKGFILLIEHEPEVRNYIIDGLAAEWDIATASDLPTALTIIHDIRPDAILLESQLPNKRSHEFVKILKANFSTRLLPIVLIAATEDWRNITDGYDLQADYYLHNVLNITTLKKTLDQVKKKQEEAEQLLHADLQHKRTEVKEKEIEQENSFITQVKEIILAHMTEPEFSTEMLCNLMKMSHTNLFSKVKNITGQSISILIRDLRMNKAAEMLVEGKINITEISDTLGFNDAKYFREVFKRHFGVSPREYIKRHEQENDEAGTPPSDDE